MPITRIKSETFKGSNGQDINYERLTITSEKNKDLTIELKLEKNELTLVKTILASDSVK